MGTIFLEIFLNLGKLTKSLVGKSLLSFVLHLKWIIPNLPPLLSPVGVGSTYYCPLTKAVFVSLSPHH